MHAAAVDPSTGKSLAGVYHLHSARNIVPDLALARYSPPRLDTSFGGQAKCRGNHADGFGGESLSDVLVPADGDRDRGRRPRWCAFNANGTLTTATGPTQRPAIASALKAQSRLHRRRHFWRGTRTRADAGGGPYRDKPLAALSWHVTSPTAIWTPALGREES